MSAALKLPELDLAPPAPDALVRAWARWSHRVSVRLSEGETQPDAELGALADVEAIEHRRTHRTVIVCSACSFVWITGDRCGMPGPGRGMSRCPGRPVPAERRIE